MEKPAGSQGLLPGEELSNEIQELLLTLPQKKHHDGSYIYQYQGFWFPPKFLHGVISLQKHFQAQDSDILLITVPKSGTTWLKALAFAIVNRSRYALENNPLLSTNPHGLVPFLDRLFRLSDQPSDLEELPKPRIMATHVPYASLSPSILHSNCRIVYMCRNPLDQFISYWEFMVAGLRSQEQTMESLSFDEAFEMFCHGVQVYGPIWEHVLGYWKASVEQPNKILFLKYEDLKEDINFYVKKLADFLGCPFSKEEESQGVIEEISKLCSFDNLKNLEVNQIGKAPSGIQNNAFFRKGKIGDWKNYLSPSMSERIEKIIEEKLDGSGLTFKKS